jgi:hypothetical protein
MARKLYTQLQIIFNDIRETVVSPVYRKMREMNIMVKDVALTPLSDYDVVEGVREMEEVSKTVLDITTSSMSILQETLSF